jgi:hypothetical protein
MALGVFVADPSVSKAIFVSDFTIQLSEGGQSATINVPGVGVVTYAGGASGPSGPASTINSGSAIYTYNLAGTVTIGTVQVSSIVASVQANGETQTTVVAQGNTGNVLTITVAESGFNATATSALSTSASINAGIGVTGTFTATDTSLVNYSDSPFFTGTTYNPPSISLTQTANPSPFSLTGQGSSSASGGPTALTPGFFSMANQMVLTFTSDPNNQGVSVSGTSSFTNAGSPLFGSPAPASALLAIAGVPVFGLMWMVRRWRSKIEAPVMA